MNRYKSEQRFDVKTGEPRKPMKILIGYHCDYCGKFLPWEEETPPITFTINEIAESEESWYYHELPTYPNIEVSSIFTRHEHYWYCIDYNSDQSCSFKMIEDALLNKVKIKPDGSLFPWSLDSIMQEARLTVVGMLLAQGITPDELGLDIQ